MIEAIIKIGIMIGGLMTAAAYFVLLERRMAAWVQDRVGPNRVGIPLTNIRLFGLGQPLADGVKFIFKEEYTPAHVDKRLYIIAPITILAAALAVFAVIPFGSMIPPFEVGPLKVDKPISLVVAPGADVGMIDQLFAPAIRLFRFRHLATSRATPDRHVVPNILRAFDAPLPPSRPRLSPAICCPANHPAMLLEPALPPQVEVPELPNQAPAKCCRRSILRIVKVESHVAPLARGCVWPFSSRLRTHPPLQY